jgi:hypothetical protein
MVTDEGVRYQQRVVGRAPVGCPTNLSPLSIPWRGVHPEEIHPEGDKGGEVAVVGRAVEDASRFIGTNCPTNLLQKIGI